MKTYLYGCDVLGAELPKTEPTPIAVREVKSNYWVSVGAGLTVTGIIAALGFTYAKLNNKKYSLANFFRSA